MKKVFRNALLATGLFTASGAAMASGTGDFSQAKDTVQDWLKGDLGITIATAAGIWGMVSAVAGNIKMAALGLGVAAVAAITTPVIETLFTAVI